MGKFSEYTKPWLRSVIRQRRMLMRINKSQKDQGKEVMAIDRVDRQLNAYPYDNDVYLARFILNHVNDIYIILPGTGSACHDKRQMEWKAIINHSLILTDTVHTKQTIKSTEYELALF